MPLFYFVTINKFYLNIEWKNLNKDMPTMLGMEVASH